MSLLICSFIFLYVLYYIITINSCVIRMFVKIVVYSVIINRVIAHVHCE